MTSTDYDRDFEDIHGLKRPGRLDPRIFQNIPDVGDGKPGLQRAMRNWVKHYFEDGILEGSIDMTDYSISNLNNIDSNIYFCSTEDDINDAITAIGTGGGIIIVESGTITLSSAINFNGGGSYIFLGTGYDTLIRRDDNTCVIVSDCNYFYMSGIYLRNNDGANMGGTALLRATGGNNITITGNYIANRKIVVSPDEVTGISIETDNVVVTNNVFVQITTCVDCSENNAIINGNIVRNYSMYIGFEFFIISGDYNQVKQNVVENIDCDGWSYNQHGEDSEVFTISGNYNDVSGNVVNNVVGDHAHGGGKNGGDIKVFNVTGTDNKINENTLNTIQAGSGSGSGNGGITYVFYVAAARNIMNDNHITNIDGGWGGTTDGDGGATYVFYLTSADNCHIQDNMMYDIAGGINDYDQGGGGTPGDATAIYILDSEGVIVSGNTVKTVTVSGAATDSAIVEDGTSDYTTVVFNFFKDETVDVDAANSILEHNQT